MSLKSRYPWVPIASPPPSTDKSMPPGLRRVGSKGKDKGRGLVATCDFPAGSAIAVLDKPLVAVPDGQKVLSTCDWCLRRGTSPLSPPGSTQKAHLQQPVPLQACTGCRYVFYCSKKCQAAAWKNAHKAECAYLRRFLERYAGGKDGGQHGTVGVYNRAVMQLLARLRKGDEVVRDAVGDVPFYGPKWQEGRKGDLEGLPGAFKAAEGGKQWLEWLKKAMGALELTGFDPEAHGPDERSAVVNTTTEIFCKIQVNAFNTEDPDYSNPGILVDTVLSMINHSCNPNAAVRLAGRTVILRALADIKEGDEIEVTYVDNTHSKYERQQSLKAYHFQCQCRRCKDDLDVYQVCETSPLIPMNSFSLQPNLDLYTNPGINRAEFRKLFPYASRKGLDDQRLETQKCQALVAAEMWAVHPLPDMFSQFIGIDGVEEQNLAYALCAACFQATRVQPYGYVAPFDPWRAKGLLVVARLLSQTAPLSAMGELAKTCPMPVLVETLARMDQVSMCEAILRLVVHYGPMAHSDDWVVLESAREMLADIESLQGRERESNMLRAWASNPNHPEGRVFFRKMVYEPVVRLSDIALLILATRLNSGLARKVYGRLE